MNHHSMLFMHTNVFYTKKEINMILSLLIALFNSCCATTIKLKSSDFQSVSSVCQHKIFSLIKRRLSRFFRMILNNYELFAGYQYIPPISGAAGAAGTGSFLSATRLSVVRTIEATDAAFCSAERFTLVGSTMPFAIMSP